MHRSLLLINTERSEITYNGMQSNKAFPFNYK